MLNRKHFLMGMASATALLLAGKSVFSKNSINEVSRRIVTINFPLGKTIHDYHVDKSSWINISALLQFLPWAEKKGLITSFQKESNTHFMRYTIESDSMTKLETYEKLATLISHKNMSKLHALGYSVQVEHYSGDAHYGTNFRKA